MMVKRASFSYSENQGTTLPGYMDSTQFIGQNFKSMAPGLDYVFGKGEAYGAEFFINKTKGKFTGWIGYTLAWTYRTFPDLNNGEKYVLEPY